MTHTGDIILLLQCEFYTFLRNEWVSDQAGIAGNTMVLGIPKKSPGHMGFCAE